LSDDSVRRCGGWIAAERKASSPDWSSGCRSVSKRHLVSLFRRLPFARVCVPSIFDALSRYGAPLRDAGITVMNLLAAAHRAAIYQFAFCREQ
jgi:hypothetical protein